MTGGGFEASSESLEFRAATDESSLEEMAFEGSAECRFRGGAGTGQGGESGRLEAGLICVRLVRGTSGIARVDAAGGCRLRTEGASQPGLEAQAAGLGLAFGEDGRLASVEASGSARLSLDDPDEGLRRVSAPRIVCDRLSGTVAAEGTEGGTAAAETPTALVEAPSLALDTRRKSLEAAGGVAGRIKSRPGAPAMGFFGRDRPLYAACSRLTSGGPAGGFRFQGGARVWQGRTLLRAPEVEAFEVSGDVRCGGGVMAVFFSKSGQGGPEERYEAGGRELVFTASSSTAAFRGDAFVVTGQARLEAGAISVRLAEGGRGVEGLDAEGGVVVRRKDAEGRGGRAHYDPEAGTITLTERPVLSDKDGGTFQADRLTFHLTDDRILVETAGQGRSVTIIKSER